ALVVVIALLIYFVSSSTPPVKPPPPPPKDPTRIETPQKPEKPPEKPPPPVVELAPVELQVVSQPPAAEGYVDGNLASKTPYKFQAKRGVMVRIEVRKRGFDPYYEELEPDGDKTINIKLDKPGRGAPRNRPRPSGPGPGTPTGPGKPPGTGLKPPG